VGAVRVSCRYVQYLVWWRVSDGGACVRFLNVEVYGPAVPPCAVRQVCFVNVFVVLYMRVNPRTVLMDDMECIFPSMESLSLDAVGEPNVGFLCSVYVCVCVCVCVRVCVFVCVQPCVLCVRADVRVCTLCLRSVCTLYESHGRRGSYGSEGCV